MFQVQKEIIKRETLWIPKGMNNGISISIAFSVDILIKNENIISEECKTKNRFEIILRVEWITTPQSWVVNPIIEVM